MVSWNCGRPVFPSASCPVSGTTRPRGSSLPGSNVLLYSDGLVEAHDTSAAMFGFPRLREAMTIDDAGSELLDRLLEDLHAFTGPDWEQEDDITLVTLRRASGVSDDRESGAGTTAFSIPGEEGNERIAMDRVAAAVAGLGLSPARIERLKTAVSEATMNAIEYGSLGRPEVPVDVLVETTDDAVLVRITDRALSGAVPSDAVRNRHMFMSAAPVRVRAAAREPRCVCYAATAAKYGDQWGIVAATGCNTVYTSTYPYNPYLVPWTNSLFENAPADAMGVRSRWDQIGWHDKPLWCIGGDGAFYDIGFQSLSRMRLTSGM